MEALETTKYNLKAQSIIESAVFNFNRNGFYGTSLEHITRSLNMTDKSIYYYFKNKEDLFIAALHHTQESLCLAITEAKALKVNALEKIQFLATQCASIDGLELLGNVPHEVTKHKLYPKIEKRLKKHHQITIGFFEMGQKDKSIIKGNPVDQWTLYTGGFVAYFNWYKFVDRSKVDYQKQIDDMRFMIERAFSTAYKKS